MQLPGTGLRLDNENFQQAARQSVATTHLATCRALDIVVLIRKASGRKEARPFLGFSLQRASSSEHPLIAANRTEKGERDGRRAACPRLKS